MKPTFFETPAKLRAWLKAHHATETVLLAGFYKKDSGKPSVTYHEALDEALAFGWIDGVRKNLSADSYTIRFTPRKPRSYWSQVNIGRVKSLIEQRRMTPAGMRAFEARDAERDRARDRKYSHELETPTAFDAAQLRALQANPKAWAFFQAQPAGYRKFATFFVTHAKKEETRARRLAELIEESARERRVDPVGPRKR